MSNYRLPLGNEERRKQNMFEMNPKTLALLWPPHTRTVIVWDVSYTNIQVDSNIKILEFSRAHWGTREWRRGTRGRSGSILRRTLDPSVLPVQLFQKLRYSAGEQLEKFLKLNTLKTTLHIIVTSPKQKWRGIARSWTRGLQPWLWSRPPASWSPSISRLPARGGRDLGQWSD